MTRHPDDRDEELIEPLFDPDTNLPFSDDRPRFDQELQALRSSVFHLLLGGRHIVVLEGEPETGRTTMLESLVDDRDGNLMPLPLAAPDLLDDEALAQACIQGFDLPTPPSPSGPKVVAHAQHQLAERLARGLRPVILLDDADDLPRDIVRDLLRFRAACRHGDGPAPGLVLVTRRGFAPHLLNLADVETQPEEIQVVTLYPWREDQIADYIRRETGMTEAEADALLNVGGILDETLGLPGRVREACRHRWLEVERSEQRPRRRPSVPFASRQTVLLAGMVLVAAGLGFTLFTVLTGSGDDPSGDLAIERLPIPAAGTETPVTSAEDPVPEDTVEDPDPSAAHDEASPEFPPPVREQASPEFPPDDPDADLVAPAPEHEQLPEPVIIPEVTDGETASPDATEIPEEGLGETREDITATGEGPADADEPDAERVAVPDWAATQPRENYTIQLIGAGQRDSLEHYVENELQAVEAHIVPTRRNNEEWYVVVTGSFPDRDSARDSLQRLPQELQDQGAWIRSLDTLQDTP